MDLFTAIDLLTAEGGDFLRRFVKAQASAGECELRAEVVVARRAVAVNGEARSAGETERCGLGALARLYANEADPSAGHAGLEGGRELLDRGRMMRAVGGLLAASWGRARCNARGRARARRRFGRGARSLAGAAIEPAPVLFYNGKAVFRDDPSTADIAGLRRLACLASGAAKAAAPGVVFNAVSILTELHRELFLSSRGSVIIQEFAFSQADVYVVAQRAAGYQEIYDTIGRQRGMECLAEGTTEGGLADHPDAVAFARALACEASELAAAPRLRPGDGEVTVVTDPHFNALLVHEIIGHPCEADRALKMEAAYAGRSWFLRSLTENARGRQVASPLLSACSDPTIEGYGHYRYDHEGVAGRRVSHIENGIFGEFLNSRATAAVLGARPNGSARASEARLVPLVRMSNTFILPGEDDPKELIGAVDRGFYLCGHLIPSIAESRENFRISARRVYEIEHGRLGRLWRGASVLADSRRFFMSIDGVGNDLRLFAVPNCGKGQPMQTKRMSNGGPTLRARARLQGG